MHATITQDPRGLEAIALLLPQVADASRREMSSAEMRAFLMEFLSALSELARVLINAEMTRAHYTAEIGTHMIDLAQKELEEVNKKTEEYFAQKAKADSSALAMRIFGCILAALGIVFACATGNPAIIVSACVFAVLEASGAMDKLGQKLTEVCGDNKWAAFAIKMVIVAVLCAATCGAAGACQATATAGKEVAIEMAEIGAEGVAAEATEAVEQTVAQTIKSALTKTLEALANGVKTSQGRMVLFQTLGQTAVPLGPLNDLIDLSIDSFGKNLSKEEKEKLKQILQIIAALLLTVACAIGGGVEGFRSKNVQPGAVIFKKLKELLERGFLKNPYTLQIGNFITSLGEAFAGAGSAAATFSLAGITAELAEDTAIQEFFTQLMQIVSQMSQQNQLSTKNVTQLIATLMQSILKPNQDPDGKFAQLLTSQAV